MTPETLKQLREVKRELEKIRAFLNGAHLATGDGAVSVGFSQAAYDVDNVLKKFGWLDDQAI